MCRRWVVAELCAMAQRYDIMAVQEPREEAEGSHMINNLNLGLMDLRQQTMADYYGSCYVSWGKITFTLVLANLSVR